MNYKRLSLGIPVYNQSSTITETIKSALSQTVPFDEIIVVDNHSTDGTTEQLKVFQDQIRVVSPHRHLGMVANWNYCINQMDAEWFSLLSGDDLLKPGFAMAIKQAIADHPTAALVRTDWDVIDGDGVVRSVHQQMSVSRTTAPPKTWQEQLNGPKVSFAAFAARRDLWQHVGGFPDSFHLFQDWMFWLKLAPLGEFVRVPASLAQYRSHPRPELERKRARLRLMDEYRYTTEMLPALPWQGAGKGSKIKTLRQRRLTDLLNYLVHYQAEIQDKESQEMLKTMAEVSGMAHIYNAWCINHQPIAAPWGQRLVSGLKTMVRRSVSS